jgi:hypothetical protein
LFHYLIYYCFSINKKSSFILLVQEKERKSEICGKENPFSGYLNKFAKNERENVKHDKNTRTQMV